MLLKSLRQTVLLFLQGFAHLEALEMLSNQSERKVQSLLSHMADDDLELVRPHLVEIKDVFQQLGEVQEKETAGEQKSLLVEAYA